ncbi:MAG: ribonuclease P protein component [Candidatus Limnocylindria bacterium]
MRRTVDIARVRRQGTSRNDRLFVIHFGPSPSGDLRLAVSASRALGTAVARNRARRRIREAIRVALKEWPATAPADILIVARPAVREASAPALRAAVVRELQAVLA